MRFVETPIFTSAVLALLPDEGYRALQCALMIRPEQGAVIPGSGGLRKMRWNAGGRGKRGGLRLIYVYFMNEGVFFMLFAYGKGRQADLTKAQVKVLRHLVREELE